MWLLHHIQDAKILSKTPIYLLFQRFIGKHPDNNVKNPIMVMTHFERYSILDDTDKIGMVAGEITRKPRSPMHSQNFLQAAQTTFRSGNMREALNAARAVVKSNPNIAEAWWILGSAANALNDLPAAESAFFNGAQQARSASAERARFLTARARPLMEDGRSADAVYTIRDAIDTGIADIGSLVLASSTLTHAGLPQDALPLAEKATALKPDHPDAWYNLGLTRQFLGDTIGARQAFEAAIKAARGHFVAASYSLAHLRRWTADDNHIQALEALQCRNAQEACRVGFTLFKEYDDIGDHEAAWDCLQHGASLARKMETWSSEKEAAIVAAWKTHLPPERFLQKADSPRTGPRRIFITGLPRSGTTLVERILSAHSQVQALGELKTFGIVTRRSVNVDSPALLDPQIIAAVTRQDPLEIAEAYTREAEYLRDGRPYTIDKRPHNHDYIGLIRLAFPDAIIIALDRNPMDALFGAYKLLFTGAHGWSYTQEDLADHYGHYRDLMGYWKQVLGDGIIDISLEALIANPETQIRGLLSACGLPFEDACLKPNENRGAVTTASSTQVRKPINAEGVGAWQRYADQLAPLKDRLEKAGFI